MDLDNAEGEPTTLASLFDLSVDGFPWRGSRPDEIEARRAQMSDLLIFDILLSSGGVRQPDTLWPPTDIASFHHLLDAIQGSSYDALKKDCLVYFLLKWHQDGREEKFKEARCIPPQFAALSDAYWHLDSGIDIARAISLLSDVRLNRDYTSKIIQAISLSDTPTALILRYLRTARPMLTEPDDIDIYALALAQSSLMEAWQYQRTFPENSETRTRLVRKILEWCLAPKPRSEPLTQLLAFPFTPFEQTLVQSYALDPPSTLPTTSVPVIQDLVCVRMIQAGKYAEAIKLERQFASVPHGRQAPQAADRRRKMVEGLLSAMPAIERLEVEDELMTLGQKIAKPTSNGAPADLTMSWEEISPVSRPLGTAVPTSKPFVLGRSARGARFSDSAMASPPSHAHSPSLVPGKSHYPSTSPAMVQPIRHSTHTLSNSQQALPLLQPLSQSPTAPLATSTNGLRFSQGNSARTTVPSLFAPTTSTNQKPRPFVQQPPPVNGTNGVSAGESSYFEAPMPIDGLGSEGDVDMHVEDFEDEPDERRADVGPAPAEFSHSVFLNANSGTEAARHKRAEPSVERLPPGAFHAEEDGFETMSARSHQPPSPSSYPPPAKSRKTQNSLARRGTEASLDRSIPGGFFAGEEVELGRRHEEDEDEVPPLPAVSPVKRATRKARSSRASSVDVEEDGPTTKPRRSTRLSVASSSPEPASPPKISASKTRKTRAAASTTSTAKAATRRKR